MTKSVEGGPRSQISPGAEWAWGRDRLAAETRRLKPFVQRDVVAPYVRARKKDQQHKFARGGRVTFAYLGIDEVRSDTKARSAAELQT
jgi:hypothetical protein